MLTYQTTIQVKLDGNAVGVIAEVDGGFQYYPLGHRNEGGEIFATIDQVKRSLETD